MLVLELLVPTGPKDCSPGCYGCCRPRPLPGSSRDSQCWGARQLWSSVVSGSSHRGSRMVLIGRVRGRGNRWGLGESGTFNAFQHCSQAAFKPSAVLALISAGSCKMKHTSPQDLLLSKRFPWTKGEGYITPAPDSHSENTNPISDELTSRFRGRDTHFASSCPSQTTTP